MAEKRHRRAAKVDESVKRYEMEIADDLGLNEGGLQTEANRPLTETDKQARRVKNEKRGSKK
ncbi:MAG: hypothetical protein HPY52_07430 [Firmicutes bacterium]|nr:hypothetical protein [Bacillota bacterium]